MTIQNCPPARSASISAPWSPRPSDRRHLPDYAQSSPTGNESPRRQARQIPERSILDHFLGARPRREDGARRTASSRFPSPNPLDGFANEELEVDYDSDGARHRLQRQIPARHRQPARQRHGLFRLADASFADHHPGSRRCRRALCSDADARLGDWTAPPAGSLGRRQANRAMVTPTYYEFLSSPAAAWRAPVSASAGPACSPNDFDAHKAASYAANWAAIICASATFTALTAADLPGRADLAWPLSPCQDLSLAGSAVFFRRSLRLLMICLADEALGEAAQGCQSWRSRMSSASTASGGFRFQSGLPPCRRSADPVRRVLDDGPAYFPAAIAVAFRRRRRARRGPFRRRCCSPRLRARTERRLPAPLPSTPAAESARPRYWIGWRLPARRCLRAAARSPI